jgi:hypothetical protein
MSRHPVAWLPEEPDTGKARHTRSACASNRWSSTTCWRCPRWAPRPPRRCWRPSGDNPGRLVSEAAFAHLCGAAPLPASSGKTTRHRFNPGGHREANEALWRIVLVRMKSHAPTRADVARRTAKGLSKREIMRCLKRYVAREVYRHLKPADNTLE